MSEPSREKRGYTLGFCVTISLGFGTNSWQDDGQECPSYGIALCDFCSVDIHVRAIARTALLPQNLCVTKKMVHRQIKCAAHIECFDLRMADVHESPGRLRQRIPGSVQFGSRESVHESRLELSAIDS